MDYMVFLNYKLDEPIIIYIQQEKDKNKDDDLERMREVIKGTHYKIFAISSVNYIEVFNGGFSDSRCAFYKSVDEFIDSEF